MLSSQRVDLKDMLYDAAKAKDRIKETAVNPLVQDGKKLVPSVTRVFTAGREIYVFLQAYKPASTPAQPPAQPPVPPPAQPLLAFVTLYSAANKALETSPIAVAPNAASRLGVTALSFSVPTRGLARGDYDCQITVLDPSTLKTTFWRAPIRIVP